MSRDERESIFGTALIKTISSLHVCSLENSHLYLKSETSKTFRNRRTYFAAHHSAFLLSCETLVLSQPDYTFCPKLTTEYLRNKRPALVCRR